MQTEEEENEEGSMTLTKTATNTVNLLGSHPEQTTLTLGGRVNPVKTKDESLQRRV